MAYAMFDKQLKCLIHVAVKEHSDTIYIKNCDQRDIWPKARVFLIHWIFSVPRPNSCEVRFMRHPSDFSLFDNLYFVFDSNVNDKE